MNIDTFRILYKLNLLLDNRYVQLSCSTTGLPGT